MAAGLVDEAVGLLLETVERYPEDWQHGVAAATFILRHTAVYDLAEKIVGIVLRHAPDSIPAHGLLLHIRVAREDIAGGRALFAELLDRYPEGTSLFFEQMSTALLQVGCPLESLQILMPCLESGMVTPTLLKNAGCAFYCLDRSKDAIPWYEKALALDSTDYGITFGYACTLIKAGRLQAALPRYFERDLKLADREAWYLSLPRLRPGDDVAGRRIVLYQEQGLGDTIQFIRFVPFLLARGCRIAVVVAPTLARLFRQSCPQVSVHETGCWAPQEGYDYATPIPDLPYIAGVMSVVDIPAPIPYLRADPDDVARFAAMLPVRQPRIGLVWAGQWRSQLIHALVDRRRSTTLAAMGAAFTPIDAALVSLQRGDPRGEIAGWNGQALCDPMEQVRDMADTAAIMASLDLVISVDTAPLHLAGALGCPVWLISRQDACWRWGDAGDRSPWYPTMRIFRAGERALGPVLQEVGKALRTWVATWKPTRMDISE
ncbi:glycosyltransferase family protein [Gluconacetobacter takamatsuzukensis]|uniref:Glycosyltransferase family protein n=2 Tax=Gluconacetobacter takamatsuzukensis TaxID=1286190 RepID=A0A7W4KAX9_9PROT|nr:tetratricopeptide repeat-containing glycosyltransferase family protein [Gluconacetobacter takamatsuzukensis]MBB2203581.1 glycosyltransferase family protein [Gluconacetobacter takamatsuzukensis]